MNNRVRVALFVLSIACLAVYFFVHGDSASLITPFLVGGAFAISAVLALDEAWRRYQPRREEQPDLSPLTPPPRFKHCIEIADSVARISSRVSSEDLAIAGGQVSEHSLLTFNALLSNPRRFHGRIVEYVTPLRSQVRQKVSSSLLLDGLRFLAESQTLTAQQKSDEASKIDEEVLFYPVVVIGKGEMQDNFHLDIKGEERTITLTYEEYCRLQVLWVRSMEQNLYSDTPGKFHDRIRESVNDALALICGRGVINDNYAQYKTRAEEVSTELKRISTEVKGYITGKALGRTAHTLSEIGRLAIDFCDRYAVVVVLSKEVRQDGRAVVRYEREYPPRWCYPNSRGSRLRFFVERLSAMLGSRPSDIEIDIRRAAQAQSYHIVVDGARDTYVGDQRIFGLDNYQMLEHGNLHYRFRKPLGQPYVHGYFRDVAQKPGKPDELRVRARFYEVPPPSIAKAAISALAASILVATVASLSSIAGEPPDSDFPALILAFPAIAAAFLGFERSNTESPLGTEITSRFSSLVTFLICLVASALYMAETRDSTAAVVTFPTDGVSVFGITDYSWLFLAGIAAANFVWASMVWAGRSVRYFSLIGHGFTASSNLQHQLDVEYSIPEYSHT